MRHVPSSSRSTLAEEAARVALARHAARIRAGILVMDAPSATHMVMTQPTTRIRMIRAEKGACVCMRSGLQHRASRADLRREDRREFEEVLLERSETRSRRPKS
jgi:hypothetical protein